MRARPEWYLNGTASEGDSALSRWTISQNNNMTNGRAKPSITAIIWRVLSDPAALSAYRAVICSALVIGLHGALLAALLAPGEPPAELVLPKPIMVDLIAPPPPAPVVQPTPPPVVQPPPEPVAEKPPEPKPKKIVKKPKEKKKVETARKPEPKQPPVVQAVPAPPAPPVLAAAKPAMPVVFDPAPPRFSAAYLRNPKPPYPARSRRLGEQGKVALRVYVSAAGRPEKIQISKSSGYSRLDESAKSAVRNWRFIPARLGEKAVSAWVIVPIVFSLES